MTYNKRFYDYLGSTIERSHANGLGETRKCEETAQNHAFHPQKGASTANKEYDSIDLRRKRL
jgi:hypothetical protein